MTDLSMFAINEFTLYIEAKHPPLNEYRRFVDIWDTSGSSNLNTICTFGNPEGNIGSNVKVAGTIQVAVYSSGGIKNRGDNVKIATALAEDDFARCIDDLGLQTDTTVNFAGGNFNRIWIGRGVEGYGSRYLDEAISKIAIYPKRLSNATLQAMTAE